MKFRALLIAALIGFGSLFSTAHAQESKHWKEGWIPDCWPVLDEGVQGISTDVQTANGWGFYVSYWCPTEFSWKMQVIVSMHSFAPKIDTPRVKAALAVLPKNQAKEIVKEVFKLSAKKPTGNYVEPYDALFEKGLNAAKTVKPADPNWRVGASTRVENGVPVRPAFAVDMTNKTRIQPSDGSAPSEVPCRCATLAIKETSTWCPWQGGPDNKVTLCRLVK